MTRDEFVTAARAAWPAWPGADDAAFARFVDDLQAGAAEPVPLGELRAPDLWLAFHAGRGVAAAVAALDASCFADLHVVLRARRADPAEAEEVVQRLRHRLLVAEPGQPSRILTYGGRGELRAWVRVAAVRAWLNLKREKPPGAASAESAEDALVTEAAGDLELELLKGKYRETFRRVFLEAVDALAPSTRLLLKLHYLDRLSMEEVGKVLGVHRLTVLRRLERARLELSEGTKERLETELRLAPTEVESLLRLIQSRLDVSLQSALAPDQDQTK
ncbi:MAG: sigma-70 family RNA polymerase sigma factor [Labilithrix sp.]|nr:sigma-70 family RNA polymerase sigma factor [Labilithrix sp.]MCW5811003.1 sigma-70 family RNA polymerase sigma factor [Labilithrix sp.]